jgi:hypothetical protein
MRLRVLSRVQCVWRVRGVVPEWRGVIVDIIIVKN